MELNIGYLRSLEDSPRVRAACVNYLRTWLPDFHPERPDLVVRAQELATSLGGHLELPRPSWKYVLIQRLFGWSAAKRTQVYYNRCKSSLLRSWDRAWYQLEGHRPVLSR
jgi:hypothetical protein